MVARIVFAAWLMACLRAAAADVEAWEPLDVPTCIGPADSCPDEAGEWITSTTIDALFVQRANTVGPLAVNNETGASVITAADVRYPTTPGVRIFQGWRRPDCSGVEVGYLGIWGMHADALAVSPSQSLALPGQLGVVPGSGLDSASAIEPQLNGTLNSLEFNVFSTRELSGCRRHDPLPWRRAWNVFEGSVSTSDWLLGIRWAGLDETATLGVTALVSDTPPPLIFRTTDYRVTTSSHLVGPQIGHRRRIDWSGWALEGWAKAALTANVLSQSQAAVIGPFDLETVRPPRSSGLTGVGMIGDLNATVVRRLGDHWGIRAGYTLIWLVGVAPAANQWDFTNTPTSGTELVTGTVFLHGATFGLEASW